MVKTKITMLVIGSVFCINASARGVCENIDPSKGTDLVHCLRNELNRDIYHLQDQYEKFNMEDDKIRRDMEALATKKDTIDLAKQIQKIMGRLDSIEKKLDSIQSASNIIKVGDNSIEVTQKGVIIKAVNMEILSSNKMKITAVNDVDVKAGRNMNTTAGANLNARSQAMNLKGDARFTAETSGDMRLKGTKFTAEAASLAEIKAGLMNLNAPLVKIANGSKPAARMGDPVINNRIVGGTPMVLLP